MFVHAMNDTTVAVASYSQATNYNHYIAHVIVIMSPRINPTRDADDDVHVFGFAVRLHVLVGV